MTEQEVEKPSEQQMEKMLERHQANIAWIEYNKKLAELNLELGLKAKYDKDRYDQEQELQSIKDELAICQKSIEQLKEELAK